MRMQCVLDEIDELRQLLLSENRGPIVRLKECLNNQTPIDIFIHIQSLVLRVSDGFLKLGWPPMRVQASYFSQNGPSSFFEVSWLRNDLLASLSTGSSRTMTSAGPGFRLVINSSDTPSIQMQSRHSLEARTIFIKNVVSPTSSRWMEHCLREMGGGRIVMRWTESWHQVSSLEEIRALALEVNKAKRFGAMKFCYFVALIPLKSQHLQNETRLPSVIVKFCARMAPLFWAHHLTLEPKAAGTPRQTKQRISREQLRKNILKLESRCQHVDCPMRGGDKRMLKVAHLTPKINLLSNVVVLCSLCYDQQFPATSVIRVRQEGQAMDRDWRGYTVEIQTRDGPKYWRVKSHIDHPLSNPRSG